MKYFNYFNLSTLILISLLACNEQNQGNCDFPNPVINNLQLNLNDLKFNNLNINNYAYYDLAGVQGLIIIKQAEGSFIVFDRASPFKPNNFNARVFMDPSRVFLKDTVNNATFDLKGLVMTGPANCNMRRYAATYNQPFLSINN